MDTAHEELPHTAEIPHVVLETLRQHQLEQHLHRAKFGDVREPISMEFKGYRFAAVGKKLLWGKQWKVFPDFLNQYIHSLLNSQWGERQVALSFEQQHPIVQWRTIFTTAHQGHRPNEKGLYSVTTGAALAWFRLAYDLYLLEHNAHLQNRLVRRLREPAHFQGARFEVAVAAMMLAAGYELNFADLKRPGKHPEFVAVAKGNPVRIAVEAKSRHRAGVLGHPGTRGAAVDTFDIGGLLMEALQKNPVEPLLIFIELNSPEILSSERSVEFHSRLSVQWNDAQAQTWPNGFPAVGVVFYNDPSPWYLDQLPPEVGLLASALVLWPERSRHAFDAKPLLHRVASAVVQRLNIPNDFPTSSLERDV